MVAAVSSIKPGGVKCHRGPGAVARGAGASEVHGQTDTPGGSEARPATSTEPRGAQGDGMFLAEENGAKVDTGNSLQRNSRLPRCFTALRFCKKFQKQDSPPNAKQSDSN